MITRSAKFIHIKSIRVRRAHLKAFFACTGAALMATDASTAWVGPHFFPHFFDAHELLLANSGKLGAAFAGFVPFFEGAVNSLVREVEAEV